MKPHKRTLQALLVAAVTLPVTQATAAEETLVAAYPDWTGGAISCEIVTQIVESWGHEVERLKMPTGPAVFEGVRSGDIDFACENWPSYVPSKSKYMTKFGGDGSVAYLGEMGIVGQSGYYVPRYLIKGDSARDIEATAPDLVTYEDLGRYGDLFATLETRPKGRILGCPVAAWDCKDEERLAGLGLDFVHVELGSETALWSEIKGSYRRGDPFVAYTWEPHWIHAELDLVEIELPEYSDEAWPASDWPADKAFNFGNPNFVEAHPKIAGLLRNMTLTNAMQAEMIFEVDVNQRKLEEVVAEWLTDNASTWQGWIPES